jgi:anti-sigma B factor antagonist
VTVTTAPVLISTRQQGPVTVVSLAGDLDLAAVPEVCSHLLPLLLQEDPRLVLDLSGLAFLDSTGLRLLVAARRLAEEGGGWLRLAALPAAARRLLSLMRAQELLPVADDVDAAIAQG